MSVFQPESRGSGMGELGILRGYSGLMSQDPDAAHLAGLDVIKDFALDTKDRGLAMGAEGDLWDALADLLMISPVPPGMTAQDVHERIHDAAEAGMDGDLVKAAQMLRDAMLKPPP